MSPLSRETRIPGRIVISWMMSGGILFGMIGTLLTMTQQLPGYDFFVTLTGVFLFGAVVGLGHGFVLAIFSKERDTPFSESIKDAATGALYSILAAPVAFLVTLWVGFAFYFQLEATPGRLIGAVIGAWIGVSVLVWTAWETWRAVRIILSAWPDFIIAAAIVATVFFVLVWFFTSFYPLIFGGAYNARQAVFISGGISVLVVGPLTTLALVGLRRIIRIQKLIKKLEDME